MDQQINSFCNRNFALLISGSIQERKKVVKLIYQQIQKIPGTRLLSAFSQQILFQYHKNILKALSDTISICRQFAAKILQKLIITCTDIKPFLPYILSILAQRTNCNDLEGVQQLPQVMRPTADQKPKMMTKLVEEYEQVREQLCRLLIQIIQLIDNQVVYTHVDNICNIVRALAMDPQKSVQILACKAIQILCNLNHNLLLNFTQLLARSILLPLTSRHSAARIGALQALNSILLCGVWKKNAFVFEILVGFRDPNSIPIKSFTQVSMNVNYLAKLVTDSNNKVRMTFAKSLRHWILKLEDRYDHHGRLVAYILSLLFDQDKEIQQLAFDTIEDIGQQIQIQKQKQFRENKQYAIDANWTCQGQAKIDFIQPFKQRPRLGARYWVRGHVRKFWHALYKQIKDIHLENRLRCANLSLVGIIYTQDYMTQYLDNFIPSMITALVAREKGEELLAQKAETIFQYIGRYCQYDSYIHIIRSGLNGQFVVGQHFIRCVIKCMAKLLQGNLQTTKPGCLGHKYIIIPKLIAFTQEINLSAQICKDNVEEMYQLVKIIVKAVVTKASPEEKSRIQDWVYGLVQIQMTILGVMGTKELQNNQIIKRTPICSQLIQIPNQRQISSLIQTQIHFNTAKFNQLLGYIIYCERNPQLFRLINVLTENSLTYNLPLFVAEVVVKVDLGVIVPVLKYLDSVNPFKKKNVTDIYPFQKDINGLKIPEEQFLKIYSFCLEGIMAKYHNEIKEMGEFSWEIYLTCKISRQKLFKYKETKKNLIRCLWSILERCGSTINFQEFWVSIQSNEQHEAQEQNQEEENNQQLLYVFPYWVDYMMFLIQTLHTQFGPVIWNMAFSTLQNLLKVIPQSSDKQYNKVCYRISFSSLLQKLLKYTLTQPNLEIKQRYKQVLKVLCSKNVDYCKLQIKDAKQHKRFERIKLIEQMIS